MLSTGYLNRGRSILETRKLMNREFPKYMKVHLTVWPVLQLFNFSLVPNAFQILFINVMGVF